jgi:release factor glutamine methyltransferase
LNTVAQLLAQARGQGLARLDAQLLLAHRFGRPRAWLIAHDEDAVDADTAARFAADCAERARGVPLAYLVGEREFHGLMLQVTPAVLVPRPDTEVLVDWALELLDGPLATRTEPEVADLGTGSGAIALAVKHACPRARMLALDASVSALAVARSNAQRLGLDLSFAHGDWLSGLDGRHFDLLLANPPYIDGDDPHLAALQAEPMSALTPGPDGMADLRRIADQAPAHMTPGGWLLLEHGHTQAESVAAALAAAGFGAITTRHDLAGLPRCTGGRWLTA